ncbi:MAG: ATP-dependent 6-phosphofructokinase [Bryobacteraceae bacterium]|nr:ATP-dependent 6-phosphofructokinase [Bryobacteraceae bacterium]
MNPLRANVENLGESVFPSPLAGRHPEAPHPNTFIRDSQFVPLHITIDLDRDREGNVLFERAGPRERIYFRPETTRAAIVTCGGVCPGLNNVIRSVVLCVRGHYGVNEVLGVRYGYHGLNPETGLPPLELTVESVSDIHELGGTILGTSRGPQDPKAMLEWLRRRGVNILFAVGGDGTQKGALEIARAARVAGYSLAVIGIPKTIDNDLQYVSRSFGFSTAIDAARAIIDVAHNEARAVINGVGLVKLMGRDSGFIAAGAALASGEVNYCLIPEEPFELEGAHGLLAALRRRLQRKAHAVIVVAEGAGQTLAPQRAAERDASGNLRHADIGVFLRERIVEYFRNRGLPINVRYIDPSYAIRGLAANTEDAILCDMLARDAAHAAFAGRTGVMIGTVHNRSIHVPIEMATQSRKKVDLGGEMWRSVLAVTGQPALRPPGKGSPGKMVRGREEKLHG